MTTTTTTTTRFILKRVSKSVRLCGQVGPVFSTRSDAITYLRRFIRREVALKRIDQIPWHGLHEIDQAFILDKVRSRVSKTPLTITFPGLSLEKAASSDRLTALRGEEAQALICGREYGFDRLAPPCDGVSGLQACIHRAVMDEVKQMDSRLVSRTWGLVYPFTTHIEHLEDEVDTAVSQMRSVCARWEVTMVDRTVGFQRNLESLCSVQPGDLEI